MDDVSIECSHRGGAAITPKAQRFTHRIIPSENDTPLCSRVFILPSWLDLQLAQNAKTLFSGPYGTEHVAAENEGAKVVHPAVGKLIGSACRPDADAGCTRPELVRYPVSGLISRLANPW